MDSISTLFKCVTVVDFFQLSEERSQLVQRDGRITRESKELLKKLEKIDSKLKQVHQHDQRVEEALTMIREAFDTLNLEKAELVPRHKEALEKLGPVQKKHEASGCLYDCKRNPLTLHSW